MVEHKHKLSQMTPEQVKQSALDQLSMLRSGKLFTKAQRDAMDADFRGALASSGQQQDTKDSLPPKTLHTLHSYPCCHTLASNRVHPRNRM